MQLSSLIDEYKDCEKALYKAIHSEQVALIRECDIRMNWIRNVIRDFFATNPWERLQQIDFFMNAISQAADLGTHSTLFADARAVIERYIAGTTARDETAPEPAEAAAPEDIPEIGGMIERTDLRISAFDRDFRYTYTSPANGRFYGMPQDAFTGRHVSEVIGDERYEKRAKAHFEKCLAGENQCYYYHLDCEKHGRLLLECQMLRQYDADNDALGAVVIIRDVTGRIPDPARAAEESAI